MRKKVTTRRYSDFHVGSTKVWADISTLKLIKAMRIFPILKKSFKEDSPGAKSERVRLESLMGCNISEIRRKWGTLRAYYNKLLKYDKSKQKRWRFYKEMFETVGMERNNDDMASSTGGQCSTVRIFLVKFSLVHFT